jgi:hypothetical protein
VSFRFRRFRLRDRDIYLLLLAVSIVVRIPFLKTYDMPTYDGTHYVNEAMSILGMVHRPGGFPIGYPIFIALLMPVIHDGVRAAQGVSFLAGLGSLFVFYSLARRFVARSHAVLGVFLLAVTPLFINLSSVTMSESLYVLWVLLGLYCFSKDADLPSGLFLGLAAVTRPEALGILGVLAALRIRRPRRLLRGVAGFAIVYCVNVGVQSHTAGKLMLLSKTNLFGTSASNWMLREAWIDFPGREKAMEEVGKEHEGTTVPADYVKRLPREGFMLIRHASPVLFCLALYGVWGRRLFLLASFVPFLAFPVFTFRSES